MKNITGILSVVQTVVKYAAYVYVILDTLKFFQERLEQEHQKEAKK